MPSSHRGTLILEGKGIRVMRERDEHGMLMYHVEYMNGPFTAQQYTTRSMHVVAIMCNRELVKRKPRSDWTEQFK